MQNLYYRPFKRRYLLILLVLFSGSFWSQCDAQPQINQNTERSEDTAPWITAYFASWNHFAPPGGNWGHVSAEHLDWEAFTHLVYFAIGVRSDGSLQEIKPYDNVSPDRINSVVRAGHRAGKPVLISLGGWGNYEGFSEAIKPANRAKLILNIVHLLNRWGFDGVDLDMEPIRSADTENYYQFVTELHQKLQPRKTPLLPRPLLTAATKWKPELFARLQHKFDQINLMSYDFSGAWGGWTTWHNSPLYSGSYTFPGTNRSLPSINKIVNEFLDAGIAAHKLGFGIDFYGYVWSGVSRPGQNWSRWAPPRVEDNVPYHKIMESYYRSSYYRWDEQTGAAYLQIEDRNPPLFISYDSPQTVQKKMEYLQEKQLGGVIIWELSGGYFPNNPHRNELLQSLKRAYPGISRR